MIGIMSEECVLHCGCYPALVDSAAKLKEDRDALLTALKNLLPIVLPCNAQSPDIVGECPKGHPDECQRCVAVRKANAIVDVC